MNRANETGPREAASAVKRPRNLHSNYHAHVYFDAATLERARTLCERAAVNFGIAMGRVHERLVGPHPRWSCQLTFDARAFDRLEQRSEVAFTKSPCVTVALDHLEE